MTKHLRLRIRDRTVLLVAGSSVEQWWEEAARRRLHASATEWPGRDALLRLSDETLGPDDDIDAAIEHLIREMDRGRLLAVRMPDDGWIGRGRDSDPAWDAPRLSDLGGGRGDDRDRGERGRGDRPVRPSGSDPSRNPTIPVPSSTSDRPTDTWSTFVAFVVVDQDGKPVGGTARCTIDGVEQAHALGERAIEIEPVAAHARIVLDLTELAPSGEASEART